MQVGYRICVFFFSYYRSEWPDVGLTPDENKVAVTVNSTCAKVRIVLAPLYIYRAQLYKTCGPSFIEM